MDCLLTAKLQRATRARAGPSHVGFTMRGVATSFATSFAKQLWSEVKTHGPTVRLTLPSDLRKKSSSRVPKSSPKPDVHSPVSSLPPPPAKPPGG